MLADWWSEDDRSRASGSPYNIRPFPAALADRSVEDDIAAVLAWRATFVDLLSDIWDVLGHPDLDLDECLWIGGWLAPSSNQKFCRYCLRPLADEDPRIAAHQCIYLGEVRAKWPTPPTG